MRPATSSRDSASSWSRSAAATRDSQTSCARGSSSGSIPSSVRSRASRKRGPSPAIHSEKPSSAASTAAASRAVPSRRCASLARRASKACWRCTAAAIISPSTRRRGTYSTGHSRSSVTDAITIKWLTALAVTIGTIRLDFVAMASQLARSTAASGGRSARRLVSVADTSTTSFRVAQGNSAARLTSAETCGMPGAYDAAKTFTTCRSALTVSNAQRPARKNVRKCPSAVSIAAFSSSGCA